MIALRSCGMTALAILTVQAVKNVVLMDANTCVLIQVGVTQTALQAHCHAIVASIKKKKELKRVFASMEIQK